MNSISVNGVTFQTIFQAESERYVSTRVKITKISDKRRTGRDGLQYAVKKAGISDIPKSFGEDNCEVKERCRVNLQIKETKQFFIITIVISRFLGEENTHGGRLQLTGKHIILFLTSETSVSQCGEILSETRETSSAQLESLSTFHRDLYFVFGSAGK